MPITLRARLVCHYCGKRNGPSNSQQKFTCQYCQADNYLDELGEITDVPASTTTAPQQYAVPLTPAFDNVEGSIFCATCLKNQYMYNAALSEYLPDPDHPEYEKFEAAIPAFKKDLERRFPTCCALCEPKVKAQLQQATYNARSDHLRRVLDRSRQRRNSNKWGWRSLLVNAAGLGWIVSLLIQLSWHILGSQTEKRVEVSSVHPIQCLDTWPIPSGCPALVEDFVGPSLLLGAVCIWWNPKWQHKLEGREGRLIGLDKFYKFQAVLLVLRFSSWTFIKDVPNTANFRSITHSVSLILILMIAGWSRFNVIQIYTPQIVDWSRDPAPLLDSKQFIPPLSTQEISPPNSQEPIPVDMFNTSAQLTPQAWRPPTPPVDDDAMEWDPTPAVFAPNLKQVKYKTMEPTPFQGTLPAFPKGGVFQARKENAPEQTKAIGLPPGFFDKSHGKSIGDERLVSSNDAGLAQPKFFPDVARADTGLENIFDKVFSLQDETTMPSSDSGRSKHEGVRIRHHNVDSSLQPRSVGERLFVVNKIYRVIAATGLAVLTMLFSMQCYLDLPLLPGLSTASMLKLLILVSLFDMVLPITVGLLTATTKVEVIQIEAAIIECVFWAVLLSTDPEPQSLLQPLWNKCVIALLMLSFIQQVLSSCASGVSFSEDASSNSRSLKHQQTNPTAITRQDFLPQPTASEFQPLRRSSSDESLASTASIATTSTASGWKTPIKNHREELRNGPSSASYGLGGLSLKNDHAFGVGSNVTGPRARRMPPRGTQNGW